jgi:hypothetical protein
MFHLLYHDRGSDVYIKRHKSGKLPQLFLHCNLSVKRLKSDWSWKKGHLGRFALLFFHQEFPIPRFDANALSFIPIFP